MARTHEKCCFKKGMYIYILSVHNSRIFITFLLTQLYALLQEDANVFFLDYGGATWALNYFQAVSDSRVAGAELAR